MFYYKTNNIQDRGQNISSVSFFKALWQSWCLKLIPATQLFPLLWYKPSVWKCQVDFLNSTSVLYAVYCVYVLCLAAHKLTILVFQVILNVTLNLFGVLFAIAAIALYSIDIAVINLWWMCEEYYDYFSHDSTPSPHEDVMKEICMKSRTMALVSVGNII